MSSARAWWRRWWMGERAPTAAPLALVLYTRPGCGACERLRRELEPLRSRWSLALELRDVGGDAALERRYGLRIPVLAIDGHELEGPELGRESIERELERAARNRVQRAGERA